MVPAKTKTYSHKTHSSPHAKSHPLPQNARARRPRHGQGKSLRARIQAVSQTTFTDEDGHPRQFTWRTIQTWYSLYKKHGVT